MWHYGVVPHAVCASARLITNSVGMKSLRPVLGPLGFKCTVIGAMHNSILLIQVA